MATHWFSLGPGVMPLSLRSSRLLMSVTKIFALADAFIITGVCSWHPNHCWPGDCEDNLAANCRCRPGFLRAGGSSTGRRCQCENLSPRPRAIAPLSRSPPPPLSLSLSARARARARVCVCVCVSECVWGEGLCPCGCVSFCVYVCAHTFLVSFCE